MNCDKSIKGIKYIQNALGHPRERNQIWRLMESKYAPKLIYSKTIEETENTIIDNS